MPEFVSLQPLVWLTVVAILAITARFSLVDRPRLLRWTSAGLRWLGIALLVLALCRPHMSEESDSLHVNFLVDVSQSVDLEQAGKALSNVDEWIAGLRKRDSWSLFAVARGVRQFQSTEELAQTLEQWRQGVSEDKFRSGTQLAEGLLATRLAFPAGKVRRTVLLTDGQETDGDIAAVLHQLSEENTDVRLHGIEGLSYPEASVVSITSSARGAFHGEVLRLAVETAANRDMKATLRIVHRGVAVQQREVQLKSHGRNITHFDVDMATPGDTLWAAEIIPAEDHFPINNRASCSIFVSGRPRVLVLHEKPREMRAVARALREQDMAVEVRGRHGMPETLEGLAAFDAVILADLPATALSPRQMQMIKRYVVDLGGGLVMLGSENSFGLGGYYKTPVEDVLPIVSRFEKEKENPSLAMVLVIDKSGSMSGLPIQLARQAAHAAVELLGPRDMIGVVGFDGQPQLICEMSSAAAKDSVQAAIDSLAAGGGTYMYPAMVAAKEMLETTPSKIRHMICLSDGHTQPADHESLVEEMADAGITVSTVALGDADKHLLASIAEQGRGRYYETDDPANVPQIFTKETMQAAKSAIKEDLYGSIQLTDHPILAGYQESDLPFSLGYVMTEAKPTAQLLLAVETGDPLLAVGRYGLGAGMAYTSDLTEKWGGEWLAWDDCGKFWAQALRGVLRKHSVEGLLATSRQNPDGWRLDILRTGSDLLPVNQIQWNAILLDEDGQTQKIPVQETGLGRYTATVHNSTVHNSTGHNTPGSPQNQKCLTLRLRDEGHDKTKVLHFHRPYPAEYRLAQEMPPALAALSPAKPHDIVSDLTPLSCRRSIVGYLYFAALASILGSVLLRRL